MNCEEYFKSIPLYLCTLINFSNDFSPTEPKESWSAQMDEMSPLQSPTATVPPVSVESLKSIPLPVVLVPPTPTEKLAQGEIPKETAVSPVPVEVESTTPLEPLREIERSAVEKSVEKTDVPPVSEVKSEVFVEESNNTPVVATNITTDSNISTGESVSAPDESSNKPIIESADDKKAN